MLEDYYYVSNRKVDSYAAQLPHTLASRFGAEVTANLGLISTKLKTLDPSTDAMARFRVVREYIEQHYDLGTTEFPAIWVQDTLVVKHIQLDGNPEVLLLLGVNKSKELCGLFGSSSHIQGAAKSEILGANLSFYPDFAALVAGRIRRYDDTPDIVLDKMPHTFDINATLRNSEVALIMKCLYNDARATEFSVRFLARHVFQHSPKDSWTCKAFTPLYVSCVDAIYGEHDST